MITIINKKTKEIINNMGTNSAFPDGNIPNITCKKTEEIIRIHDKSELAKKIMNETRKFKFNDTKDDIIITETEEETKGKESKKQKQTILNELSQLDNEIPRIIEDLIEHTNFIPHTDKQKIIDRKKYLRGELKK